MVATEQPMKPRLQSVRNLALLLASVTLIHSCVPSPSFENIHQATTASAQPTRARLSSATVQLTPATAPSEPTPSPTAAPTCPPFDEADWPSWAIPTPSSPLGESAQSQDLVGLVYSDYPPSTKVISGGLIVDEGTNFEDFPRSQYYLLMHVRLNDIDAIWLSREVCTTQETYLQLLDVLAIFPIPQTQAFFSHGCGRDWTEDPEIVAIAATKRTFPPGWSNINPLGGSPDIIRAWRASRVAGRFIEIPTEGLTCLITGEGPSFPWDEP
jgi:hypothetical protein